LAAANPNWWTNCSKPEKWTGNIRNDTRTGEGTKLELELERGIIEYVEHIISIAINYTPYITETIFFLTAYAQSNAEYLSRNSPRVAATLPVDWGGVHKLSLQMCQTIA
jgi:hypothetical protein